MDYWQIFVAFYVSGVVTAMYALWRPSWLILKELQPDNIFMRRPILSNFVVFWIFFIFIHVVILSILIPSKTEKFIRGFVQGAAQLPKEEDNGIQ